MGVSVSTGLTYLKQPEQKQLLMRVCQTAGHLMKKHRPSILNRMLLYFIHYIKQFNYVFTRLS